MQGIYYAVTKDSKTLIHHGVKGMHWGIRRYQNADGTLTSAGKKRMSYRNDEIKNLSQSIKSTNKQIADNKKRIIELNKNGKHSSAYKDMTGNDNNVEIKTVQKQLYNDIRLDTDYIVDQKKRLNTLKNAHINDRTYVEQRKTSSNIGRVTSTLSAIGGIGLATYLKKKGIINSGREVVKTALAVGVAGTLISANAKIKADQNFYKNGYVHKYKK